MSPALQEQLDQGACMDLLPAVVDKYFQANVQTDPFEHFTARAICGACAVRSVCLTDAITSPAVFAGSEHMVRAGEPGSRIREMRRRHFLLGESAQAIVASVLGHEEVGRSTGDMPYLRAGRFPDAELLV